MSTSDPSSSPGWLDPDDPRLPSRPLWGIALALLPVIGVFLVVVAYAVIVGLGTSARSLEGAEVTWRFEGCEAAQPLLEARLDEVGLPATWTAVDGGYTVKTQLTGNPVVDDTLPGTLTTPAALEVRAGDEVLATSADVVDAGPRADIFMVPYVLLRLDDDAGERIKNHVRSDPKGRMTFHVDGKSIGWQSNTNPVSVGELEINLTLEGDEEARMHAVAAWSVTLDHGPLPCPVTFAGPTAAPAPGPG
ncbi:MAG: hypothetical protein AAGA48_31905 [Myxococcota bacterium]